jgi:hypothetical protein
MVKSTKSEVEKRVALVVAMLGSGATYHDIVRYGTKNWGVASRQIDCYIKNAREIIREKLAVTIDEKIADIWNSYQEIYRQQMNAERKDLRGAKLTLDSMTRMVSPQDINLNISGDVSADLDVEKVIGKYDEAIKAALETIPHD